MLSATGRQVQGRASGFAEFVSDRQKIPQGDIAGRRIGGALAVGDTSACWCIVTLRLSRDSLPIVWQHHG